MPSRLALPVLPLLVVAALLAPAAGPASAGAAEPSYRDTVLADHPTSYWRLGEQSGAPIAADELGRHAGSYGGPPTLGFAHSVGDTDTAIDLDGLQTQPLGQFIQVSDDTGQLAFPGIARFTLEAWVRPRGFNDVTRRIVSKEDATGGWLLGIQRGGLVFSRWSAGVWHTLLTGIDANRWTHVAATYDTRAMRIYLDGGLVATRTSELAIPYVRSALSIGATQSRWRFYAGGLDELAIYPTALSAVQVLAHSRAR